MEAKLTFRSAVFLSLTFMVGTGIFIKVKALNALSHNQMGPIVALFLFFFLVMLAFTYVLSRIIPRQTGDMGFVEWSKSFCPRSLHISFCRFVRHFYYPCSLFLFSVYGILGITEEKLGIFSTLLLAFFVVLIFVGLNLVSFKWSKRIQTILFLFVLIPIVVLPMLAFLEPGGSAPAQGAQNSTHWSSGNGGSATGLDSLGPWLSLISGLPSLLFIYDGFYSISTLKSRLKRPGALKYIVLTSMGLITFLYLFAMVGFTVGDPLGGDFRNFRYLKNKHMTVDVFEFLMACASFMTLNSIVMGGIPQLYAMGQVHHFRDEGYLRRFIFYRKNPSNAEWEKKASILVMVLAKTLICFLVLGIVMYSMVHLGLSDEPIEVINSLADMVTAFVFLILASIIGGSLRKGEIREPLFILCARLCLFTIGLSIGYLMLSYLVGVSGYAGSNITESAIKLTILLIFLLFCFRDQIHIRYLRLFRRRFLRLYPEYRDDGGLNLK